MIHSAGKSGSKLFLQHLLVTLLLFTTKCSLAAAENTCSETNGECINPDSADNTDTSTDKCGLYLAESTIPGAGLGIFTARTKLAGDSVGTPDMCIPVIDMHWHNGGVDKFFNPFGDYFWSGNVMGMAGESDSEDIEALCPGLDCAVNCHIGLINTQKATPLYDESNLHRSRDAGVGTFTPYHNGTSKISHKVPAGGELFKFYGDNWFETRPKIFDTLPLSKSYPKAEKLLHIFVEAVPQSAQSDVYSIIVDTLNTGKFEGRILNALPKDYHDALRAVDDEDGLRVLMQPQATRSVEWLEQNGRCIDNIAPGQSTIPQAARGAFATRNLKKDQVITTSPLHHIPDRKYVNMYNMSEFVEDSGKVRILRHIDQVIGKQVLLNYCYGHPDSTMLLFPYSSGINYINHNKTLANVKIRWAKDFSIAHKDSALERKVEQFSFDYKTKLAFDYVALRDIQKGEELFMDYGDDWEEAWLDHVENFQPSPDDERYASGRYWNEKFADMMLRTIDEQKIDPYPGHLQMRCHHRLKNRKFPKKINWKIKDYGYPCRIKDRFYESDEYLYTVEIEILGQFEEGENGKDPKVTWLLRTDVPRSGMAFFDRPFHSDLHLPNAFRQPIGLPEQMIPEHWFNAVEEVEDEMPIEEAKEESFESDTAETVIAGQVVPTPSVL